MKIMTYEMYVNFLSSLKPIDCGDNFKIFWIPEENNLVYYNYENECIHFYKGKKINCFHRVDGPAILCKNKRYGR